MLLDIAPFQQNFNRKIEKKTNLNQTPARNTAVSMFNSISSQALKSVAFSGMIPPNYKSDGAYARVIDLFNTTRAEFEILPVIKKDKIERRHLHVKREQSGDKQTVTITLNGGKKVLEATKKIGDDIKVGFLEGKGGAFLTIDTPRQKLVTCSGYEYKDDLGLEIKFPGIIHMPDQKNSQTISFTGRNIYGVLAYKPEKSVEAVNSYFDQELYKKVKKAGESNSLKYTYENVFAVGGFGERMGPVLDTNTDNKPSVFDPSIKGHRLVHFALDNAIAAGVLDHEGFNPEKDFLGFVEDDPSVGTAGGFVEAINNDVIQETGNPVIVWPGDGISDINYNKALKFFEDHPDAGLMLIGIPVTAEQIKDFGIVCIDKDFKVFDFVEKPIERREVETADSGKIQEGPHKDKYLANIAVYVMKPEIVRRIKEIYRHNKDEGRIDLDFGKDVLGKINGECARGEIKDNNGVPLRMYAYAADGDWNDVGTPRALIQTSREIAYGVKIQKANSHKHVPYKNLSPSIRQGFFENVDLDTGIVYLPGAREIFNEDFVKARGAQMKGNVLVMNKN